MYTVIILVMRIMGKRQIGQLEPYELVVALMISELAAMPMQDTAIPLLNGILPIVTLLVAQLIVSLLVLKSTRARKIFCGSPRLLINNGHILEENLRTELYNIDDLLESLRLKGYPNVAEVNCAILENNGELSIFPKNSSRGPTVKDLNLDVQEQLPVVDLIIDGKILMDNLINSKIVMKNFIKQMKRIGANNEKDILYSSIDSNGIYFFQLKNGR